MKKAISLIVLVSFILFASSPVFAASTPSSLKSIKHTVNGSQDTITLSSSSFKGYKVMWLSSPDRLVIDIPNNKVTIKGKQTINVNSKLVKSIRFSQLTKTTARVVFDTKGKLPYTVKTAAGSLTFILGKASPAVKPASSGSPVSGRGDVDRPAPLQKRLVFSASATYDKLIIPGSGYDGYNVSRLTDPDRIVIDVPNLSVPADQQSITTNSSFVRDVRTSATDPAATRIVLDTVGQPQYRVEETADQLAIITEAPVLENLIYHNSGDSIYLSLNGAKLTEITASQSTDIFAGETAEDRLLKLLYTDGYDNTQIRYSMTFPSSLADLGSGLLQINDGVMSSIEITNDTNNQTTSISFNAKSRFVYETISNPETNTTEISILKPYAEKDRLVVIDAGHGGSDPGAQSTGLVEKNLNLKIALKVNDILKSKNIKTYMTRDDDTFIPLKSRSEIANNLNAALFLSVHNNAYNSSEFGTETLYYPGETGKSYAKTIQDTLVNALGTFDRGIIQRPNLVVLNSTKMPAVIAEIAFLTNTDDRAKLNDEAFIEKAAQALADGVINALQ